MAHRPEGERLLNTVQNTGRVLDIFTHDRPEWGVTEIGKSLGMPKSNVHALVVSLSEIGLLTRTPRGRYRLGWHLLTLAERTRVSFAVREHALPVMRSLVELFGETVVLAVLQRGRVLYIDCVNGTHPTVRLAGVRVGTVVPAYCTAVGKVLLADLSSAEARELVGPEPLAARTATTVHGYVELDRALEEARIMGVSYERGELVPDACSVAAPIRDDDCRVVAAVAINVPAYRFDSRADEFGRALVKAAGRISKSLAQAEERPAARRARLGVTAEVESSRPNGSPLAPVAFVHSDRIVPAGELSPRIAV